MLRIRSISADGMGRWTDLSAVLERNVVSVAIDVIVEQGFLDYRPAWFSWVSYRNFSPVGEFRIFEVLLPTFFLNALKSGFFDRFHATAREL